MKEASEQVLVWRMLKLYTVIEYFIYSKTTQQT